MAGRAPTIDESGAIVLPPIVQDSTETFMHNLAYALNAQLSEKDKPKKILLIGTKNEKDLGIPNIKDPYYSHEPIKQLDLDPNYSMDGFPVRYEYTYGDVTIYYIMEGDIDESKGVVNAQDVEMTNLLALLKRSDEI